MNPPLNIESENDEEGLQEDCFDYLAFYSGEEEVPISLWGSYELCGTIRASHIPQMGSLPMLHSPSNLLVVEFFADFSERRKGFNISYWQYDIDSNWSGSPSEYYYPNDFGDGSGSESGSSEYSGGSSVDWIPTTPALAVTTTSEGEVTTKSDV